MPSEKLPDTVTPKFIAQQIAGVRQDLKAIADGQVKIVKAIEGLTHELRMMGAEDCSDVLSPRDQIF